MNPKPKPKPKEGLMNQVRSVFGSQVESKAVLDKSKKVKRLIGEAGVELAEYLSSKIEHPEKTVYNVHLAQAAENLWTAYQFLLEEKKGEEITEEKGFAAIKEWTEELGFDRLYDTVYPLHIYHYEGLERTEYENSRQVIEDILATTRMLRRVG